MNFGKMLKQRGFMNKNWIYNKTVLYFILILSLTNLFVLFQLNDMFSVALFFLVGFLTSFFSKNMVVIMCMSLFFTNVLKYGPRVANPSYEGFEEGEEDQTKEKEEKEKEKEKESMENNYISDKKQKKTSEPEPAENDSLDSTDKKLDTKSMDIKNQNSESSLDERKKALENMNKYKSLLDTLQNITTHMKELKGV